MRKFVHVFGSGPRHEEHFCNDITTNTEYDNGLQFHSSIRIRSRVVNKNFRTLPLALVCDVCFLQFLTSRECEKCILVVRLKLMSFFQVSMLNKPNLIAVINFLKFPVIRKLDSGSHKKFTGLLFQL